MRETLCQNYHVPNRRSLIVLKDGLQTAKEGSIWIGENGKNYQPAVTAGAKEGGEPSASSSHTEDQ